MACRRQVRLRSLALRAHDLHCAGNDVIEVEFLRFDFVLFLQQASEVGDDTRCAQVVLLDRRLILDSGKSELIFNLLLYARTLRAAHSAFLDKRLGPQGA